MRSCWVVAVRRYSHKDEVSQREFSPNGFADGFDTSDDVVRFLFGIPFADVVGSKQDNATLRWSCCFKPGILDAPEDIVRTVSADAEVDGFHGEKGRLPNLPTLPFPAFRDGITHKEDIAWQLFQLAFDFPGSCRYPVTGVFRRACCRDDGFGGKGG